MRQPEPQTFTFSSLLNEIENGVIKIPQFQRDFVWNRLASAKLIDSIIKGYPIGTFIFWKTRERLRSVKNLGNILFKETEKGDFANFVLDGQQRLTSLYCCLKGVDIDRDGKIDKFENIYVNLNASDNEEIVTLDLEHLEEGVNAIKLKELIYGGLVVKSKFPEMFHNKLDDYSNRLQTYLFPVIVIKDANLDVATEIFTRINVSGKSLSLFEIMVAKTYDESKQFDLSFKYEKLMSELAEVGYDTISDATILQVLSVIVSKECKRSNILSIEKSIFIENWDNAINSIRSAVDYFRGFYRIPVSKLLPYNALLVPFAYFFFMHKHKPTGDMQKRLQDYFWRSSLTGRFSSSVESKLAQDIAKVDEILNDSLPKYDVPIDTSPQFIKDNGWFSASRSYVKAILSIYSYHQPKSFIDDSIVRISNDWLKIATSKNYHHFFPKSYIEKKKDESLLWVANHILNITIVDDWLNKQVIGANPPSKYMKEFIKKNEDISSSMKTHLIGDFDKFGITTDDYNLFIDQRAKWVSRELNKRIIPQEIDSEGQNPLIDDYEVEDGSLAGTIVNG